MDGGARTASSSGSSSSSSSGTGRLDRYHAKRDFAVTGEPHGSVGPPSGSSRFVVQRHRASRLHYDLRLEAGGVLVSWAVPKGPTLDPDVRRMAVHVEDHPLDYFDFEGVIPAKQYGAGDVVVWDWGEWSLADGADPLRAIESGTLHFDLHGEKLEGRFVLVRRDGAGAREQWLLLHKRDEHAVVGWDPEDHPRSVKTGRTNDEVRAAPSASWSSRAIWAAPTADELAALDALGARGTWELGGHRVPLTDLDRVVFPATRTRRAVTRRDLVRHHASMAPAMLPYLADRPVDLHRFPGGIDRPGRWQRAVPASTPDWIRRWRDPDAGAGEAQDRLVLESPAGLAWAAGHGAVEIHPWISTASHPRRPTWVLVDVEPGPSTTFDDVVLLAHLHRTAFEHLGLRACPTVSGRERVQIWVPVADRYSSEETRAWVEQLSRAIGATVPELVGRSGTAPVRTGGAHSDDRPRAPGTTLAPFGVRAASSAPVTVPIRWDELDDPDLGADRWTIGTVGDRLREVGDPLAPLIGLQQVLPSW